MKSRNNKENAGKDLNGKKDEQPVNDGGIQANQNPDNVNPETSEGDVNPDNVNPETNGKDNGDAEASGAIKEYKKGSIVDRMLALYPQYERAYVSKKGFVFPENTPEWQRGDAILYENKYFTK